MEKKLCKTCKYWYKITVPSNWYKGWGYCEHPKMLSGYNISPKNTTPDSTIIESEEGWSFYIGPEFSCIHYEKKKANE